MKIVCLDPGHGGGEVGAVNSVTTEKALNLDIAMACKKYLESIDEIKVVMTRDKDYGVPLSMRCDIANDNNSDLFISIHNNASGQKAEGFEVYHFTESQKGGRLANIIGDGFLELGQTKRYIGSGLYAGSKSGDYYVLKHTNMPAVLIEYGFMDSKDFLEFDELHERVEIGENIAKSILKYWGIKILGTINYKAKYNELIKDLDAALKKARD